MSVLEGIDFTNYPFSEGDVVYVKNRRSITGIDNGYLRGTVVDLVYDGEYVNVQVDIATMSAIVVTKPVNLIPRKYYHELALSDLLSEEI